MSFHEAPAGPMTEAPSPGRIAKSLTTVVSVSLLAGLLSACAAAKEKSSLATAEQMTAAVRISDFHKTLQEGGELKRENCKYLGLNPRIHSIGSSRFLVFEPESKDNPSPTLDIIVEGSELYLIPCTKADVKILGTVNAKEGADYEVVEPTQFGSAFTIRLKKRYLSRLKSGDQLEVWISIDGHSSSVTPENADPHGRKRQSTRVLTYATRRFSLYSLDDYRSEVLANRVKAHNIHSFPLTKEESNQLFGPVISDNFFVVRLSIRNDQEVDKLISTGMILASGRVMVEPKDGSVPFTIPVELAPESLEQIYTILDDEEARQIRPRVFRGLEFVGALGTAANLAFVSSKLVTESLSLFTGVFLPETKKLWPDRWPGYERNIVAFALQDLFKVPKGAVVSHKFIFFPKNKIEGLISDHHLLGRFRRPVGFIERVIGPNVPKQPAQPRMAVISVAFDHLDIPFENVFSVSARTLQERLADAQVDLRDLIRVWRNIGLAWIPQDPALFMARLRRDQLTTAQKKITAAQTALSAFKSSGADNDITKETRLALLAEIKKLAAVAKALEPDEVKAKKAGLLKNEIYGLDELEFQEDQIAAIRKGLTRGASEIGYEDQIKRIKNALSGAKKARVFYLFAAKKMIEVEKTTPALSLGGLLDKLKGYTADTKEKDAKKLLEDIQEKHISMLKQQHEGLSIIAEFKKKD